MRQLVASLAVLLVGSIAFGEVAQAQTSGTGRIQVIHTSPDLSLQQIDVYLNDELRPELKDLGFREATPWMEFPAGRAISVVATRAGSDDQIPYVGTQTVVVEDSIDHYILIDGIVQGAPDPQPGLRFRLGRLRLSRTGGIRFGPDPLDRYTRVGVYHASPDMGGFTYDLFQTAGGGLVMQNPVQYGQASGFISLPAGDYVFRPSRIPEFGEFVVGSNEVASNGGGDTVLLFFSGYLDGEARGLPGLGLHAVLGDGTVRDMYPISIPSAEPPARALASMRVGPNPVRGQASVHLERDRPGRLHVEVSDALGRRVWERGALPVASGDVSLPLDVVGLAPGVYGVRVVDDETGAVQTGRFTVAG